ncbi:MAG TPA: histidine kinase [Bryobacteraceae bacterium]|nr:histidine kinase [Bryobacteraceae bacterium]
MLEQHSVTLLVKLAVAASLASILVRLQVFKRMLLREQRTVFQRFQFALGFGAAFGAGVGVRVITGGYPAVDLGLEGSLLAGMLGGYLTGIMSGGMIALPAMLNHEWLSLPLFAGIGVLGGLVRDLAPHPEEIWRFSPFLNIARASVATRWFHLLFFGAVLLAEGARAAALLAFGHRFLFSIYLYSLLEAQPATLAAIYITTLFAVTLPLKIWNNTRNEDKLERQQRLLNEARLAALTRQINPHFLFNTLNSISSLIRIDPERARGMIYRLSNILRRAMREHENLSPLREELSFVDDYMTIETARFGDKLRFEKDVDPETLDRLVPSMILQPLVENSVRHGLSSKVNGGTIRVRSRLVDERLHLSVEDDGVGIPETKLATLFEQGIGISNVNERLQVLFAGDYRMWIDSQPGEGTHTEIEIPELRTEYAAVS